MNTETFKKLYDAALYVGSDLMDLGRKEFAWEILRLNNDFLVEHYPNYSRCNNIALIDDLTKIVTGEADEGSCSEALLDDNFDGNAEDPAILEWLIEEEVKAFNLAFENSQEVACELA